MNGSKTLLGTRQTRIRAEYPFADMVAVYFHRSGDDRLALMLLPADLHTCRAERRDLLDNFEVHNLRRPDLPAWQTDSLIQFRTRRPDHGSGVATGLTMRNGPDVASLKVISHTATISANGESRITTTMSSDSGLELKHHLIHPGPQAPYLRVVTEAVNRADHEVTLEMLSSFALGGITPFDGGFAPGRLRLHRFRSYWSAEGRHVCDPLEHLHLDRSWASFVAFSERFGQVGSMPTRQWFPTAALEDRKAGVVWGAQLAWAGSWQMEVYRQDDLVNLSGGLADREFGQWFKTLSPGESLTAPAAVISCHQGDVDQLCQRLTRSQQVWSSPLPAIEHDQPVVFNEWCSSWGTPEHDLLLAQARVLKGKGVRYFVIDSGWFAGKDGDTQKCLGDWLPRTDIYPQGLAATMQQIRHMGMVPGLWFEIETVTANAAAYHQDAARMLHLDGQPIVCCGRRFWDLRRDDVVEHLLGKMLSIIQACGTGYVKIDYNATLPFGVDGDCSPGEGLRRHIEGVYRLLDLLHRRAPNVVVEICASGGHRLEPSLTTRAALLGSSDAHECPEIPVIAANLHRLIRPEQSLVWAVLRSDDSPERIAYTMAATFLGRPCLSGDVVALSADQWRLVDDGLAFSAQIKPIIAHGTSVWH